MSNEDRLWQQLISSGLMQGPCPETTDDNHSPWYIRTLQGVAGWIAALFMLGFVATAFSSLFRYDESGPLLICGALLCAVAWLILRSNRAVFLQQLGLATSFCGQFMVAWGLIEHFYGSETGVLLALAGFQALLALLMPNFLHRVCSSWFGMVALGLSLQQYAIFGLASALSAALFTLIWLNELRWLRLRTLLLPISYGLAIALLQFNIHSLIEPDLVNLFDKAHTGVLQQYGPLLGHILLAISTFFLIRQIIRSLTDKATSVARITLVSLLLTAAIALLLWPVTGAASALLILVIGFYRQRLPLLGLGICALVGFVSWYYYSLHTTLLLKATYLAVLACLLLIGFALLHWYCQSRAAEHSTTETNTPHWGWLIAGSSLLILALVNFSIYQKEQHLSEGQVVLLELAPVDPRSLMQGDYMRLNYALSRTIMSNDRNTPDGYVAVRLDRNRVAQFMALKKDFTATAPDTLLLRYRIRNKRLRFATNAFFFEEGSAVQYEQARYGEFRVNPKGELLLWGLRDAEFKLLGKNSP